MFNIHHKEIEWDNQIIHLETGKLARQSDGAVLATTGGTSVLCTVVAQKKPQLGAEFFPLTVHYQKKAFAIGKIPIGFLKREGRPSEHEILIGRLIDRSIRPLFKKDFYNETQVICTLLSQDQDHSPDVLAIIGVSAALSLSGIPFAQPLAGVRVGYINDKYILNPSLKQLKILELDLLLAGTEDHIVMVEAGANELSEQTVLEALQFGHQKMMPVIQGIKDFVKSCAKPSWAIPSFAYDQQTVITQLKDSFGTDIMRGYQQTDKLIRQQSLDAIKEKAYKKFVSDQLPETAFAVCFGEVEKDIVRGIMFDTEQRIDGRNFTTIRPIKGEISLLNQAHGSALFTRGETQALVTATLGTTQDEQIIDSFEGDKRQNFILHYNFLPYSVNEIGRLGVPGRREIGHGKLAWRAIYHLLPDTEDFPYTLRVVSEITESNGSSSMATVCGASLALMDAGVPLIRPVAGIAMGLIKEEDKGFIVLSDILGDEDHLGDMDFKVAGTVRGITALQMDIKTTNIDKDIIKVALEQARLGRVHVLVEMSKVLSSPREEMSRGVPRIRIMNIMPEKIREVIGSGGKVIHEITEKTGTKIDIKDDGKVKISAYDDYALQKAYDWIQSIVVDPSVGDIYTGTVVKITDFGAFVNFLGRDGLVHISEIAPYRIANITDVLNMGDEVKVKVVGFKGRDKIKLSMRQVDQKTGEDLKKNTLYR